jgi:hypothetical protein
MPTTIASPERRWRAGASPLLAAIIGWVVANSLRVRTNAGPPAGLPAMTKAIVICSALAVGCALAVLVMRTHLAVTAAGIEDHRLIRVTRIGWAQIGGFEVGRPGGLWGGFCVQALRHDGTSTDLLSTRAYSRIPSAGHVDELHRISWTLADVAARHASEHGQGV